MTQQHISIVEVGPRDGLQNESTIVPVEKRVELIDLLSQCGFLEIEVGSFVSPKWIPQLANTRQVFQQISKSTHSRYSALVPNERGMMEALDAGLKCVSVFTAASETFSQKNTNCSIQESFERFKPVMKLASEYGVRVRGYVSCAITCPFEGDIAPIAVTDVTLRLIDMGCAEVSLGDTIGRGTPKTIGSLLKTIIGQVEAAKLAIHCHDTYGNAVDNVLEAINHGVRVVDSAIRGLGGCPYAILNKGEKARGNVATETIVDALQKQGFTTNIDQSALQRASQFVATLI